MPQIERDTFLEGNPVNEITTGELQQAIKERKERGIKLLRTETEKYTVTSMRQTKWT